ncbi:protein RRNAD1 [Orussus abietinus]|uniref:protein RRNAD1 n=1 Tax=Orussus abietinus TaxID=222816 RepID=UPI00062696E4|nr:protein RRNAD1 [Orussus abietinus]
MATAAITCDCSSCVGARVTIQQIFCVLRKYGWLLDSYVVDFYYEDLWQKLPEAWRIILEDVSPRELGTWISGEHQIERVWPLTLLTLRQIVSILTLNRDCNGGIVFKCVRAGNSERVFPERNLNKPGAHFEGSENSKVSDKKFKNIFSKHVKIKKRHEIEKIAEICANCAVQTNCECIVDVGAGMGHLARALAYKYGLCTVCIEQQPVLSEQARKWDDQLLTSLSKHVSDFTKRKPLHVSATVKSSNSSRAELTTQLLALFRDNFYLNTNISNFGFVGLHPCGDLAATLLKVYAEQKEIKYLCIVGCCYMKLTLDGSDGCEQFKGYPLSKFVSSCSDYNISYNALEVACHALENYCDKLKEEKYNDLIVHAYRAALECILISKNKVLRRSQVRSVKLKKDMTFEQYCNIATEHFKVENQPTKQDCEDTHIQAFLNNWRQIVAFSSLRFMLAPLIETIILLDRALFLSEKGLNMSLKSEFDPKLSPRNFVLTSFK